MLPQVSLIKTLYFNFNYFPIRIACRLPVFILRHTFLRCCQGSVILPEIVHTGMIRIGVRGLGVEDYKYKRVVWYNKGTVQFEGTAYLGSGSRISVSDSGKLVLGDNFVITGASTIICEKEITFGNECLLSWDVLLMDSDFHDIIVDAEKTNYPQPINIGNHVWIGCQNTILKGVNIPDNVIIASNSVITRSVEESNIIVGGNRGNIIIKKNVNWSD